MIQRFYRKYNSKNCGHKAQQRDVPKTSLNSGGVLEEDGGVYTIKPPPAMMDFSDKRRTVHLSAQNKRKISQYGK
jgi:hypothetical protein